MIKKSIGLLLLLVAIVATLFLNGNILTEQLGIPPLAKVLNPWHGLWSGSNSDRDIELEGKDGPVRIVIDRRAVPHIYAETMADAFYGQGYIEARDRTFQMQFIRQVATGQLGEYFGDRTLSYDKWTHRKGIPAAVKDATKRWATDKAVSQSHMAYVSGANAYLAGLDYGDYPFEMKVLDIAPKEWTLEAAVSVFKYMGNMLAGGNDDIEHTNVKILLGEERYQKYYKETEAYDEPIIPTSVTYDFPLVNEGAKPDGLYEHAIYDAYYEKRNKNIGSNNWALAPSKTASGSPILCSDPHLSLSLPSIWYEVNIITPETNVYGVSFPGLPGIMIGFNEHIAWGETNVGHDVQDLYHIRYADDDCTTYHLDDKVLPIEYRYDTIFVKGAAPVIDTNRITHWGPIVKRSNDGLTDIAMDWLVAKPAPPSEGNTFVRAMQCKDYDCFLRETSTFVTPAQNFLYADKSGDIGLRVNGLLPARLPHDGRFVAEGDSSRYGWQHWIPREQNPQAINPPQAYLTSSNQRSAGPDYPYYYTGGFERYRNRAINDHLDTISAVTTADMMEFQHNNYSKLAEDMVPMMLAELPTVSLQPAAKQIYETMLSWNYNYDADLVAPTYFEKWYRELRNNTWDEIAAYRDTMAITYPLSTTLRDLIRDEPNDQIFDRLHTIPQETAGDVIRLAFDSLVAYAGRHDAEYLRWGHRNRVSIRHVAQVPGLDSGPLFAGGCGDVINAQRGTFGPSWRMVIGLGEQVEAYGIIPGGQSGDPRSAHYMDLVEKWRTGQYDKLLYGRSLEEYLNY